MRHQTLAHRFVRNAPRELEPGVLYISVEYATAVHSCCCGCGERVITPFTPTDWQMTFDGDAVSLHPSVGNWNQGCRSHYVIERNQVIEAGPWSRAQIEAERRRDKMAKSAYFAASADGSPAGRVSVPGSVAPPVPTSANGQPARSTWSRFWTWVADRVRR
jgi:hypothetical protein